MHRIYGALIEIAAAAVFTLPLFCLYNKLRFHGWKRTLLYTVFSLYLTALLALVGFPNVTWLKIDFAVNIIPFADMASDFVNACLNVLLFIPFGFFLPILWESFRSLKKTALTGLITTLFIELSQIFTYRTTDINDIITNTVGTAVGYFAARRITGKFTKRVLPNSKTGDFYIVCGTVGAVMFFFQPFISRLLWEKALNFLP